MQADVLLVNAIGPAFTGDTVRAAGIGGSELEVVQLAEALAERGHKVIVANGVASDVESHGVRYVPFPFRHAEEIHARALYIERGTTLESVKQKIHADTIVIRATDIMCEYYEPHRKMLSEGHALLVGVSQWQLRQFRAAIPGIRTLCIPPMLGPTPPTEKVKGRFVYASAPCKGLDATLRKWTEMYRKHPEMKDCHLLVALPGYATGEAPPLALYGAQDCRVEYVGVPTVEDFRKLIASAEGLYYVNEMAETFCCTAALAERSRTRTHILCQSPLFSGDERMGGIPEALAGGLVTTDPELFEQLFMERVNVTARWYDKELRDYSPAALVGRWEEALGLAVPAEVQKAHDETIRGVVLKVGPTFGPGAVAQSAEALMPDEGPLNLLNLGPDDLHMFGALAQRLQSSLTVGGSELGLGMSLFSLAVSIRARDVVEIGRFKGFSTLALAGALRFNSIGWDETRMAKQRPDVDYAKLEAGGPRKLVSIDKHPMPEARQLIADAGLSEFVQFVDEDSAQVKLGGDPIDLLLIDGDHTYAGLKADVARFVPHVRSGGYVVLHDYFGWWDADGKNGSAIAKVAGELKALGVEQLLIDTGYASFVIFRKGVSTEERMPKPVPARADGKPTVGLVLIAKNENPIVARALGSCASWVDCVTAVVDAESNDGTAELCERMGAEVHVRPYAGSLAETRNDALRIAEQRTDYMLLVDADDLIEGKRPEVLDKDVYDLMIHDGGIQYPRGQLIKSRRGFRFSGCDRGCKMNIPHEYLEGPGAVYGGILPDLKYRRMGGIRGVSGWQDQAGFKAKYLRHARDLGRHYVEHPDHLRTIFYLGQSYRDADEPEQALPWYRKRAAMQPDEEGWFSQLRVAELVFQLQEKKGVPGDPVEEWLKAYEMRRQRADPLVALAVYYRDDKRKQFERAYIYAKMAASLPQPEGEHLFLVPDIYVWVAKTELALTAHYTGRHDEAVKAMQAVLTVCPDDKRQWAQETMGKILDAQRKAMT